LFGKLLFFKKFRVRNRIEVNLKAIHKLRHMCLCCHYCSNIFHFQLRVNGTITNETKWKSSQDFREIITGVRRNAIYTVNVSIMNNFAPILKRTLFCKNQLDDFIKSKKLQSSALYVQSSATDHSTACYRSVLYFSVVSWT